MRSRPVYLHNFKINKLILSRTLVFLLALLALAFYNDPALAQNITIGLGDGNNGGVTQRAVQMIALVTILSLAPSILIMVTAFTRIAVVLSLLRTAIGVQQSPPNSVIVSLALFLTAFIMAPVFQKSYDTGIAPLMENKIELPEAFQKAVIPFKVFMLKHVRDKDLQLFVDLSKTKIPATPQDISLRILIPAFMISELRRAFEIGFLLFVPFVVIDMVVASVLMSMGMMMLPPVMISLPFKLIFFVLVDGWHLIAGSLVKSYTG
ncbi:MAG: flagellar type III secretion system pore protein FliP [Hyphomicrobiaceae bacterium]|nr:flagellar type III secretion system pore protein FliP [Hyphomicrobiaceae bacterium]